MREERFFFWGLAFRDEDYIDPDSYPGNSPAPWALKQVFATFFGPSKLQVNMFAVDPKILKGV